MSNIPTVPGSEMDVHTPEQSVRLDSGAIESTQMRGAQALAGGAESIGNFAGGLAHDLQKAKEARIAADVDLKMRTARQTFIESLRNDPNEHEWMDRAKQVSDTVRQDIASGPDRLPPGMKQEVESAFKSWQGSLMVETKTLSNVQLVNRAWGTTKQDYTEKLRDGDAVGAMHSLQLAKNTRIADPAELDQLERDIPKTIALNFIETGLQTNPKGTTDLLKSGASLPAFDQNGKAIVPSRVLTPKQMEALVNTGRIRTAAWQRENGERMLVEDADPITGLVPEEAVKDKMESGEIDARFGRNFISAQDRKVKADSAEKAREITRADGETSMMIAARTHDPMAWGVNPDLYAHELTADAAAIIDPAKRQRAMSDINRQLQAVKKTGEIAERPVERQMYQLMNEDRDTNTAMLPVGVEDVPEGKGSSSVGAMLGFGFSKGTKATTKYTPVPGGLAAVKKMDDTEIKAAFGPDATKDDVIQNIQVHAARLQHEMSEWFKSPEGQKATFEQANAHRQQLEKPYVLDAVRNTLAKKEPAYLTTREEYEKLPAGAPFIWNGQLGYKP